MVMLFSFEIFRMLVNISLDDADLTPHIEAIESHKIKPVCPK